MQITFKTKRTTTEFVYDTNTDKVIMHTNIWTNDERTTTFERHELIAIMKSIEVEALKAGHNPVLPGEQR